MTAISKQKMTVTDFLNWVDALPTDCRYELDHGVPVAMAPGTAQHVRAIMAIANAISVAIGSTQVSCEVFVKGPGVLVDENSAYIPDVSVNCGEGLEDNARFLSNPIVLIEVLSPSTTRVPLIVVEVLSPSTEGLDKAGKLADYFSIPSIAHYLIVDLKRRYVAHHSRGEGGMIPTRIVREGSIALDPPGITIAMADTFGG